MVNFNSIYRRTGQTSISDSLVYSYMDYNKIFANSLVNYMEELTESNVKFGNINNTVFVIDEEFSKYSQWDSVSVTNFWNENYHYLSSGSHYLNIIELLSLLSYTGPMYLNINDISILIRGLYNKDIKDIMIGYINMNFGSLKGLWELFEKNNYSFNLSKHLN